MFGCVWFWGICLFVVLVDCMLLVGSSLIGWFGDCFCLGL